MAQRTAAVTSASGGSGMELAHLLAGGGYDPVTSARRADRLRQWAAEPEG